MAKQLFLFVFLLSTLGRTASQSNHEYEPISIINGENLVEIAQLGQGWVQKISWSPNGNQLAVLTATGIYIHGGTGFGTVLEHMRESANAAWDSGQPIFNADEGTPTGVTVEIEAFFPNGSRAVRRDSGRVQVYSSQGELIAEQQLGEGISQILVSNSGERVIVASWTREWRNTIFDWNIRTDQIIVIPYMEYGSQYIGQLAVSTDDRFLAVQDFDNHVRIFDLTDGMPISDLRYTGVAHAVAFSPSSAKLVSGSETLITLNEAGWDNSIFVWDTASWDQEAELNGHNARIRGLDFSANGKYLLSVADWYDEVLLWDFELKAILNSQRNYEIPRTDGFFIPGNERIALVSVEAGVIELWTPNEAIFVASVRIPTGLVARSANISNRNATFAATGLNTYVCENPTESSVNWMENPFYDCSTNDSLPSLEYSSSTSLAFDPADTILAIGSILDQSGYVEIWNLEDFTLLSRMTVHEATTVFGGNRVWVAFSPSGDVLLAGGSKQLVVIDAESLQPITTLSVMDDAEIISLAFSPDGRFIATGTNDGTVRIWGVPSTRGTEN